MLRRPKRVFLTKNYVFLLNIDLSKKVVFSDKIPSKNVVFRERKFSSQKNQKVVFFSFVLPS